VSGLLLCGLADALFMAGINGSVKAGTSSSLPFQASQRKWSDLGGIETSANGCAERYGIFHLSTHADHPYQIQDGVRGARGDDSSALKRSIPDYLNAAPAAVTSEDGVDATVPAPPVHPKIQTQGTKVDRGFANPQTARLLLPVRLEPTEEYVFSPHNF
jgi:hypothetical protein